MRSRIHKDYRVGSGTRVAEKGIKVAYKFHINPQQMIAASLFALQVLLASVASGSSVADLELARGIEEASAVFESKTNTDARGGGAVPDVAHLSTVPSTVEEQDVWLSGENLATVRGVNSPEVWNNPPGCFSFFCLFRAPVPEVEGRWTPVEERDQEKEGEKKGENKESPTPFDAETSTPPLATALAETVLAAYVPVFEDNMARDAVFRHQRDRETLVRTMRLIRFGRP